MTDEPCESCHLDKPDTKAAYLNGRYYRHICPKCLGQGDTITSSAAGYERRRGYEDNAQYTIQPYDANGKPRAEFYRLYPQAAGKVFKASELEQVKRTI